MKSLFTFLLTAITIGNFAQTINGSIFIDNVTRTYIIHLPASYTASAQYPLVFNLHGYTSDASQQMLYTQMNATADSNNFIVVYPNGVSNYWNAFNYGANDIKFIDSLIEKLSRDYSIDRSSVYSCGMSNGGFMSYSLACHLSNKIAAIASVTGSLSAWDLQHCAIEHKMPVMQIHGTADPIVNYQTGGINAGQGNFTGMSIETCLQFWKDTNDCLPISDTINILDINTTDSSTAQLIRFRNCADNSEVYFYKILNGGHTWPSGLIDIGNGNTNRDFNASTEIWNFFKRHKLNTQTGIRTTIQDESFIKISPNPFTDKLKTNTSDPVENISIFNTIGNIVYAGKEQEINTSRWPSGIYFANIKTTNSLLKVKILKP
ncbi:MAG: T9SS type A sorting domain-containing protein [Chitinophagales bacterium]|nr:T9SS type A sorting domain-containing protein [Chitinophagales bacterium]MCO5281360.1 T9SS type A sorting domain-containing protein [Chitinophagales bacterium]OJV24145.1 MAG: hypothetical protein BGO32_03830 [Bacteroidetes bacterium 37-13]HRN95242.1 PHB depolymerase family esterase [Chitinophagales bacterium]HRP39955.1 PHB depolymerase family esterase [Chitinophagales bacterium]